MLVSFMKAIPPAGGDEDPSDPDGRGGEPVAIVPPEGSHDDPDCKNEKGNTHGRVTHEQAHGSRGAPAGSRFGDLQPEGVGHTQEELAQLVGASREAVNKALSDFAARGWLRLQMRAVHLLNIERLQRRAHLRPPPVPQGTAGLAGSGFAGGGFGLRPSR